MNTKKLSIAFSFFVTTAFSQTSFAQKFNWADQTGAFLTPSAYTAASPAGEFCKREVGFHYLNSGNVAGNDYQLSVTEMWPSSLNSATPQRSTATITLRATCSPTASMNFTAS
jgi:hypothetical protein